MTIQNGSMNFAGRCGRMFIAMLAFSMFASAGLATVVVPLSLRETIRQSDAIVVGTVLSSQSRWGDSSHRWMATDYAFSVESVPYAAKSAGKMTGTITLTYWGGTIDGETQLANDVRLPKIGEKLLVILRPGWNETLSLAPTVGVNQGLLTVTSSADGKSNTLADGDGRTIVMNADGEMVRGTQGPPVGLTSFEPWLQSNVAAIKAGPAEVRPSVDPHDPRLLSLYGKHPSAFGSTRSDHTAVAPLSDTPGSDIPVSSKSNASAVKTEAWGGSLTSYLDRVAPEPEYGTFGQAYTPIVINDFPSSFAPWSPEDQYQMSKWNYYANIFQVYTTPSGTFSWPDGIFDLDGWIDSSTLYSVYGDTWDANTIAVTYSRFDIFGMIIEADIAMNPAFSYTLDDEWVYNGGGAQGFRQVMIHELGHVTGLEHQFNALSVMNYMPSAFRFFGLPYLDDAEGVRYEYPGNAVSRTDLGVYLYYSSGYQSVSDASYPSSVTAGGTITPNYYTVENVGTTTIGTPTIQWYLSTARNFGSTYYYLGTATYPSLPRANYFIPSTVSRTLTVPSTTPAGDYYLAAYIPNDGGVSQSSFPFSNNYAFSRNRIHVSAALSACSYGLSSSGGSGSYVGGSASVNVIGSPTPCNGSWSASSDATWLALTGTVSGTGAGTTSVAFNVATNSGPARTAHINFSWGGTYTITQDGAPNSTCSYFINYTALGVVYTGTATSVNVSGFTSPCTGAWTASADSAWITLTGTKSGSGGGNFVVPFSVSGNTGAARVGHINFSFGATITITQDAAPNITSVRGDFNADGFADILYQNSSTNRLYLWYMSGRSVLTGSYANPTPDTGWQVVAAGDFNGDGQTDILFSKPATGQLYIWYMSGNVQTGGNFLPAPTNSSGQPDPNWHVVGLADINNDGSLDVVFHHVVTGVNFVWYFSHGTYIGGASLPAASDLSWNLVGVGDFDGDGHPDLFFSKSTGENYIFFLNQTTKVNEGYVQTADSGWHVAAVADYNNDGHADIVWQHSTTHQGYLWNMSGRTVANGGYLSQTPDASWAIVGPK